MMMILKILGHPLTQFFSFAVLLVGSPYYGGLYIFFLYHAVQELLAYAVTGWLGVLAVLCTLFITGKGKTDLQFAGLLLMFASLAMFIFSSPQFINIYVWRQLVPVLTLLLFAGVAVSVTRAFIKRGGV